MKAKHIRKIRSQMKEFEVTSADYRHLFGVFDGGGIRRVILARTHEEAIQRFMKKYDSGNFVKFRYWVSKPEKWATYKVKEVGKTKVFTKYF